MDGITFVMTKPYGREGEQPLKQCAAGWACVGSSGDNMCGGYVGGRVKIINGKERSIAFCEWSKKDRGW